MGKRMRKLKNVRLHREGTDTLVYGLIAIVAVAMTLWIYVDSKAFFWAFIIVFGTVYGVVLNFFRCPKRYFDGDTEKIVVAPADGKVVVIEEVVEDEYFHDKRLMVSIFMTRQLVSRGRQGEVRAPPERQLPQGVASEGQ